MAILLYHRGMSCRSVARHLSTCEEPVSPTAVSIWYRRAAFLFDQVKPVKRRKIVVDETSILIQKDAETLVEVYLWVAVDSDRKRIVHVALTQGKGRHRSTRIHPRRPQAMQEHAVLPRRLRLLVPVGPPDGWRPI